MGATEEGINKKSTEDQTITGSAEEGIGSNRRDQQQRISRGAIQ